MKMGCSQSSSESGTSSHKRPPSIGHPTSTASAGSSQGTPIRRVASTRPSSLDKVGFLCVGERTPHLAAPGEETAKSSRRRWPMPVSSPRRVPKFPTGIMLDEIQVREHLANGGFCSVYACQFREKEVAVKVPRRTAADPVGAINDVKNEIRCFKVLKHENLVRCIGAGQGKEDQPFIILEQLRRKNLAEMCGTDTSHGEGLRERIKRRAVRNSLPFRKRLDFGLQFARFLKYIHEDAVPGGFIIHRDLKTKNIGLSQGGRIKVYDLGLARIIEKRSSINDTYKMTGETGSQRFMAPEVFRKEPYNEKADMYSFGLILWEILTLKQPFLGMSSLQHAQEVILGGVRPPLNKAWPEEVKYIITNCWLQDASHRLSASVVVRKLESLLQSSSKSAFDRM